MMRLIPSVTPSWMIGSPYYLSVFSLALSLGKSWAFGLVVHTWGVRLLLIRWHLCWHWSRPVFWQAREAT